MILNQLKNEKRVLVSAMSAKFGVSEETIRRDMEKLEQEGYATRTYGGAIYNEDSHELPYEVRKRTNVEAKERIAREVAKMINDGDYIMLDSSTTALCVIKSILHKKNITLITNSIEILIELCNKPEWNILSTGGMLKEGGLSLVGYQAEKMISGFHVDLAICSCKGIDEFNGITDSNERDAEIKKAFFKSANHRLLAVDSSKFDKISFVRVGDIADVDVVVTDKEPTARWIEHFSEKNVELLY
jgi:DeoR/GlpR family transcriptional regulator of sugar metabolism